MQVMKKRSLFTITLTLDKHKYLPDEITCSIYIQSQGGGGGMRWTSQRLCHLKLYMFSKKVFKSPSDLKITDRRLMHLEYLRLLSDMCFINIFSHCYM